MNSDGVITAPVNDQDAYVVTGTPLWTNPDGTKCYMHAPNAYQVLAQRVNPASKHKPVVTGDPRPNVNLLQPDTWWRGKDGQCGYTIPTTAMAIQSQGDDPVWSYTLEGLEMARAWDWDGYWHFAPQAWGLPSAVGRITAGGSWMLALNLSTVNARSITYGDILAPKHSDDNSGIYVSVWTGSASSAPGIIKQVPVDWSTGKGTVTYTAAELQSFVPGTTAKVHLFGMLGGKYVSLRNHSSVVTLHDVTVYTTKTFDLALRGEFQRLSGTTTYYLTNFTASLIASYHAGGTLAAGSYVMVFPQQTGLTAEQYKSRVSPIWQSGTLGAQTVASGSILNVVNYTGSRLTLTDQAAGISGAVINWYGAGDVLLATLTKATTTVTQ